MYIINIILIMFNVYDLFLSKYNFFYSFIFFNLYVFILFIYFNFKINLINFSLINKNKLTYGLFKVFFFILILMLDCYYGYSYTTFQSHLSITNFNINISFLLFFVFFIIIKVNFYFLKKTFFLIFWSFFC